MLHPFLEITDQKGRTEHHVQKFTNSYYKVTGEHLILPGLSTSTHPIVNLLLLFFKILYGYRRWCGDCFKFGT